MSLKIPISLFAALQWQISPDSKAEIVNQTQLLELGAFKFLEASDQYYCFFVEARLNVSKKPTLKTLLSLFFKAKKREMRRNFIKMASNYAIACC